MKPNVFGCNGRSREKRVSIVTGIISAMILLVGALLLLASAVYEAAELEKNIKM